MANQEIDDLRYNNLEKDQYYNRDYGIVLLIKVFNIKINLNSYFRIFLNSFLR